MEPTIELTGTFTQRQLEEALAKLKSQCPEDAPLLTLEHGRVVQLAFSSYHYLCLDPHKLREAMLTATRHAGIVQVYIDKEGACRIGWDRKQSTEGHFRYTLKGQIKGFAYAPQQDIS